MGQGTRRLVVMGRTLAGALLAVTFASTGLVSAALAAPSSPGPGGAAGVPAPVARLAEAGDAARPQQRAQDRASLARAAEEVDEDTFLSLSPSCAASTKKKVKPDAVLYSARKAAFGWVLTSRSGLRKTGTVTVKRESVTTLKLPTVKVGSYRVVVTEKGVSTPAADETFDVALCVQVKTGCHTVRFTNPARNPAALVSYEAPRSTSFDLRLAPGQSRTVRVDDKAIAYEAWAADDEAFADLGHRTVKVKQSCRHKAATPSQNAVQTSALVGCSATGTAPATLFWSSQKSLRNRVWDVVDAGGAVVAKGSYGNGRDKTVRLAPGTYTYRSHANKNAKPFERTTFTVLRCVQVTPLCRAVQVQNPNGVAVELLVLDPEGLFLLPDERHAALEVDEEDEEGWYEATLPARGGVTVPWASGAASVFAVAAGTDDSTRFVSFASPFPLDADVDELPRVDVPQDC